MKKIWKDHSLSIIILLMLIGVLATGTWATWTEFRHNEQAGTHHGFFSQTFLAYYVMQLFMNFAPELMGLLVIVLLTKRFRERFSAESK